MQTRYRSNYLQAQWAKGFSMLELMITIALLGILVALAVPSFQSISVINRLSGSSNELLTTMQIARSEAIRRGARVVVCKSTNPDAGAAATCSTAGGNWASWIAFVDDGAGTPANAKNGTRNAGEILVRTGAVATPMVILPSTNISAATPAQTIIFRPEGLARSSTSALLAAQLRLCIPATNPAQNARDVALAFGSRTTVIKSTAATCVTAPGN